MSASAATAKTTAIFLELKELRDFAACQFAGTGLENSSVEDFILSWEGVAEEFAPVDSKSASSTRAVFPRMRWVIRTDELKILDILTDAVKSAAAVGFFTSVINGPQLAAAVTGILVAGAKLARQCASKGIVLGDDTFRTLAVIKANAPRGVTDTEVHEILLRSDATASLENTRVVLANLAATAVPDGSIQSFAVKDGSGRWHVNAV